MPRIPSGCFCVHHVLVFIEVWDHTSVVWSQSKWTTGIELKCPPWKMLVTKMPKDFMKNMFQFTIKDPSIQIPSEYINQKSILFSMCVHHSTIWYICNTFLWHFGPFFSVSWKNTGSEQSMKGRSLLLNQLIWEATVKDSWMDTCWRKGRRMEIFKRGNSY